MTRRCAALLVIVSALVACGPPSRDRYEPREPDAGEALVDAGSAPDAGAVVDAGGPTTESDPIACSNGRDDDGDGYLDCVDFDCRGIAPCGPEVGGGAVCSDGLDNDGDGYTDCVDFGCRDLAPCGPEAFACDDGLDNDGDRLADCADPDCAAEPLCAGPDSETSCTNRFDDDGDGLVDCADPDCTGASHCGAEGSAATCADRHDNDGDGFADCADAGCLSRCANRPLRVATWNVQSLGSESSDTDGWNAMLDIVRRLDADVLCLQEVQTEESAGFVRLAALLGYPYRFQGLARTGMAGSLTNACLSRRPIVHAASLDSKALSPDPLANETGRDIVEVRVEAVQGRRFLSFWTVHLKSSAFQYPDADRVRRQVEMLRVGEALNRHSVAHPGDARVVLGDFNEELDGELGQVYPVAPEGLPPSWQLGSDLSFPLTYDPFAPLFDAGFTALHATHEDSTTTATRSRRRLDYVFLSGIAPAEAIVYDACKDDGHDDGVPGRWLALHGSPLACDTSARASDHLPVVVDLDLD